MSPKGLGQTSAGKKAKLLRNPKSGRHLEVEVRLPPFNAAVLSLDIGIKV
jgi:hypothetical protein